MSYDKEKQVATAACLKAAKLCEKVRKTLSDVKSMLKDDKSPVTIADYGSQALICHGLKENFPDDPIIAEENAGDIKEMSEQRRLITHYVQQQCKDKISDEDVLRWIDYGRGNIAHRYWTLDPIDGTKGYLRGDQYAIALALVIGGQIVLGIIACPALDEGMIFWAVRNHGAYRQDIEQQTYPVRIKTIQNDFDRSQLQYVESIENTLCDHEKQDKVAQLLGISTPSIRLDSMTKYCLVASGKVGLYLRFPSPNKVDYRENIWDHAAGVIVVEESGGYVTDMDGKELNFHDNIKMLNNRGVIVSNNITIHQQLLHVIKQYEQSKRESSVD
ncbi:unnamed protein product [Didymodactylos carnosus]|uniref:3'(2'),5'-bisphosphate nucleotidase n=1 Tax=Didymodactylos carnosus TaxID=1234261 RepID=A0A814MTW5_9BILA|nr:unnamed protein product [Didymodactylos carnosus]CAF1081107.1 unnamed protein product [Didymodactylos carnosus]CAF3692956.1 unnamed protein product [Didymodactylos carnosus]CAF3846987.1 unnamed protein product [Didymodactylos carnosus]